MDHDPTEETMKSKPKCNDDEIQAERYLQILNIGPVRYEPDGNIPPDFAINSTIAVNFTIFIFYKKSNLFE